MFDRTWTVVCAANAGPIAIPVPDVNLPGGETDLEMSAWGSGLEGANAYIFEDSVVAADAANRLLASGKMDALMVVPRGGIGCVAIPYDIQQRLTVYFDTANAQIQAVTIRIREL